MKAEAEKLYNYAGYNPFTDSQGRNFSDLKIKGEFCPISKFWTLFNDHHEILLGTRGSGKTFLLKMMRRSMIANLEHATAKKLMEEKKYYPLYVPMHMETVASLNDERIDDGRKIELFKFVFNSLLAESIVGELISHIDREYSEKDRVKLNVDITTKISAVWFPNDKSEGLLDLHDIEVKLRQNSYSFDYVSDNIENIPVVFRRDFAGTLISIQPILSSFLNISNDSMWIICIDEAEFIPIVFQKCINSFMRSNTNRIALKIATLPFYWRTLETLDSEITISPENDFNFQVLDLDCDSEDYVLLTNKLCVSRLSMLKDINISINCLEDFLGTIGNDNRIDYYRDIFGEQKASTEQVIGDIVDSFSDTRKKGSETYSLKEKTIHQKFATILYVREIQKLVHTRGKGHLVPGWYAGADIVRKTSQGNPRLFIRLMSRLFAAAITNKFSTKTQHQVVEEFAEDFCKASLAIEVDGHLVYEKLGKTGMYLSDKVHNGPLISVGESFKYRYVSDEEFNEWKSWIQRAVAFSKLWVSEEDIVAGITKETIFHLSNAYAVKYWIPMRSDVTTSIPTDFKNKKEEASGQLSLFTMSDD